MALGDPRFQNRVRCEGRNSFFADGSGRGGPDRRIAYQLENVPGVPKFMAKKLAPKIEEFIVNLVTPNLKQVNTSLGLYLDAQS